MFVYGTTKTTASFPGPLIEAIQGVSTYVTWNNYLPDTHILPWDPTLTIAEPKMGGIPTVVHLHGGVHEACFDGNPYAWFTRNFREKGPKWSRLTYRYSNIQHPGNLWYHDHALGLTRQNILSGLLGPYVIRNHIIEDPFMLPSGPEFDRHLIIADRSFYSDGSIYMNAIGNNPDVHPQWRPEYFGDTITVNGKAWPFLSVYRRKYRFRILNASNARYFRLQFSNGMTFTVIGSDTSYLTKPIITGAIILSPSEIFDVVVDFSTVSSTEIELTNDAPYPYPEGTPASLPISKVMKFLILPSPASDVQLDYSGIPPSLVSYQPARADYYGMMTRYISLYEYLHPVTGTPVQILINGKRLEDPVTETPKTGSTEIWHIINLTEDNHPFHSHLAMFQAVKVQQLQQKQTLLTCLQQSNDVGACNMVAHAVGSSTVDVPEHEKTWKNVVKIDPGTQTTIIIKFNLIVNDAPYPFDATAQPGFLYHCHVSAQ